jgi:hypothetical protein
MSYLKPQMSITLPRNFTYHSQDSVPPKTPDNEQVELTLPPPPRHATCRPKRSRPGLDIFMQQEQAFPFTKSEDVPIPSIELHQEPLLHSRPPLRQFATEPSSDMSDGLLPHLSYGMFRSPRTPPAQIHASPFGPEPSSQWELRASSVGMSTERPSSSCSGISDSSISSEESFVSHPSFGGSCTSPESDVADPFVPSIRIKRALPDSPSKGREIHGPTRTIRSKTDWSVEMDNHLWNTYQIYLQDPTVTPFKMVPGSIPPLGVSHRVAREAKRTWSKVRWPSQPTNPWNQPLRDVHDEAHAVMAETPNTITPIRSGSTTPIASAEPAKAAWPRSESATRRRLKELCKKKSSIPIHYQRLLASRSPSPFVEQFSRRPHRPSRMSSSSSMTSFSGATRDLEVALVSSSATGALAQLTTGDSPPASDEWFNQPVEATKSAESSSSKVGLGIDVEDPMDVPRLGSPFVPKQWGHKTWGPSNSRQNTRPKTPINHETMHVTGPRLLSPASFDPFANANKRRAQHQLEDELSPGGTDLQGQTNFRDLFKDSVKDNSQRRVRLRNRGVTLGAVGGSAKLNRLFSPPTPGQPDMSPLTQPTGFLKAPAAESPKRLGSPLELDGNKSGKRPVTSRHTPSLSDPFVGDSCTSSMNIPSINQALDSLSRGSGSSRPFDDMEPGLKDAERMNRQIKNYFASRS